MLSSRAAPFQKAPLPYLLSQITSYQDIYDEIENENGKIPMAVAENKLCNEMILSYFKDITCLPSWTMGYTSCSGHISFKNSLARFLSTYLFNGGSISPDNLVISPGCCALLHQLSLLLFEPGDSVLVPTPYYPAFDADFYNIGGVFTFEVNNPHADMLNYSLEVDSFEQSYNRATEMGKPPKAILITNPSNPLGIVYNSESLRLIVKWARSKSLHVIFDEVYALSCFSSHTFKSIYSILRGQLENNVHILWSFSKDFGGSGLRCGVLYSQSQELLGAIGGSNDAFQVSNIMQEYGRFLVSNYDFVNKFLVANRRALQLSYELLSHELAVLSIPVIPAVSGIFAFADFRVFFPSVPGSYEDEDNVSKMLCDVGVIFTPGKSCHCQIPGFFRICYAWLPIAAVKEMTRRIAALLKSVKGK